MNNVLEDFLDYYSYLKTAIGGDDIREFEIRISKNEIKAISNLIAENKELKEMLKHRIEYTNKLEEDLFQNASNYVIPKSKVEELIQTMNTNILNAEKFDCDYIGQCRFAKYVLQSLLGKE